MPWKGDLRLQNGMVVSSRKTEMVSYIFKRGRRMMRYILNSKILPKT